MNYSEMWLFADNEVTGTLKYIDGYGVKSEDGRRFMKSEEISRSFMESPAYEILFEELVTNDKAAADFVNAVMNVGNSAATPMISTNTQN